MSRIHLRSRLLLLPWFTELDPKQNGGLHLDLWNVTPSGDWSQDTALGRQIAADTLNVISETGAFHLLSEIAKAWKRKGIHSGVNVGYGQFLAERAVR